MRNQIIEGVCPAALAPVPDGSVDLTVTSPPYDGLRRYADAAPFDLAGVARELYRVTRPGGVVVWVVSDQTVGGSETLTAARQALHFKDVAGFRVHDTMIYQKENPTPLTHRRYEQSWEYMFVFSRGAPRVFHPITVPLLTPRKVQADVHHSHNYHRGNTRRGHNAAKIKGNVWAYRVGYMLSTRDREAYGHPAIFPEQLALDHVLSWTDPGDLVLDPYCGSGTTLKMAWGAGRDYLGVDCSGEYCRLSRARVDGVAPGSLLPG